MKYMSEDGKVFSSIFDCFTYENELSLNKKREEEKKAKAEMSSMITKIKKAEKELDSLVSDFEEKYNISYWDYDYFYGDCDDCEFRDECDENTGGHRK